MATALAALALVLSVACTEKVKRPPAAGVPLIVPPALRLRPSGRAPAISDHAYGGDPPAALTVCEYGVPALPAGSEDVVMTNACGAIAMESGAVAPADALSVTFTVKLAGPALP